MSQYLVLLVLSVAAATTSASKSTQVPESDESISVNLDSPLRTVSDQFLSVTLGPTDISKNWANEALKSQSLINMGKALSPAILRVGGTDEDYVTFKNQSEFDSKMFNWTNFTVLYSQWDALNEFSQTVGWDMVYGLNSKQRNPWPHGSWDTTNAEELLKYTISKGYDVSWELGNEPDLYSEGTKITTEQLAEDFKTLKQLLAKLNMTSKYVAGPDVATLGREGYLEGFLKSLEKGVINAVTWHQYYTNGRVAKLSDFIDNKLLDHLIDEVKAISEIVERYQPGAELWLGETSNTYGGGTPGISNTYVAGFMWLDKLGLAAIFNHTRVMRQDFAGYNYGLVDKDTNTPLPDFWLSVLYKRLVGTKVLDIEGSTSYGRSVRVYAHCAKLPLYSAGDVVLILLNMNNMTTSVTLTDKALSSSSRDVYWLTPPGGTSDLQSRQVMLNGDVLKLNADAATVPDLTPKQQAAGDTLQLPALSFGYYVFKSVKAKACMS